MTRTLIGAALGLALAATAAHAACTQQELQAKAAAYSKRIQEVIANNPNKAQAVSAKVQESAQKLQEMMKQPGAGMDAVCSFYDELMAELDKL
jgi:hypothetical protein